MRLQTIKAPFTIYTIQDHKGTIYSMRLQIIKAPFTTCDYRLIMMAGGAAKVEFSILAPGLKALFTVCD